MRITTAVSTRADRVTIHLDEGITYVIDEAPGGGLRIQAASSLFAEHAPGQVVIRPVTNDRSQTLHR
jgi:hypothetical protein